MDAAASRTSRRKSARGHSSNSTMPQYGRAAELLDQTYWVALGVCVLVVPLTMAGIREYGFALVLIASLTMGAAWSARQLLYPAAAVPCTSVTLLTALAIGLVMLQLQPLSTTLLSQLSPFNSEYLTLWGSESSRVFKSSSWQQISIAPEATRSGLVLLIAYVIIFLTLIQQLQTQEHVDRLVKLIALAAVSMAVIGLGQVFLGNGKYLWFIEHPTRSADWPAKGTFRNQNHFAQFLALGFGPLIWWWHTLQPGKGSGSSRSRRSRQSGKQRSQRSDGRKPTFSTSSRNTGQLSGYSILTMAGAALLCLAALMSLSRGGIVSFAVAAIISACVLLREQRFVTRLLLPAAAIVCCAVLAFGTEEINHRLDKLRNADSLEDVDSARMTLWQANAEAIPKFWPTGAGVGSHPDVYPIWMAKNFGVRFSHAESGFLQVLLETGVCGAALLCLAILLSLTWCFRGWKNGSAGLRMQVAALTAGLAASLTQSVVDFVWYIPACMVLTLIIVACLFRLSQLAEKPHPRGQSQTRIPTVMAGLLLLSILPLGRLFADTADRDVRAMAHWNKYRADIRQSLEDADNGTTDTLNDRLDAMIGNLENCLAANPFHNDAHTALAPLYLQRFETRLNASENQLSLGDIRDTVDSAVFATSKEMHEWLGRVCGDSVTDLYRARMAAQEGLARRPLRGELYIVLTETGFLTEHTDADQQALIEQAIRLRPNEPRVLYAAGLLANESGHSAAAWKMWQRASSLDTKIGRQIVRRSIDLMPIRELLNRLASTPDMYTEVFRECRHSERDDDMRVVAEAFKERYAAELDADLAGTSHQLASYAQMLLLADKNKLAVRCLYQVTQQHPGNVDWRRQYAVALTKLDNLKHAHRELRWLRLRMPGDPQISALLQDVETRMSITRRHSIDRNSAARNGSAPVIHQVSRSSNEPQRTAPQPERR